MCNYSSTSVKPSSQKELHMQHIVNPNLIYTKKVKTHKLQYKMQKFK
jgi:hypothetical protein